MSEEKIKKIRELGEVSEGGEMITINLHDLIDKIDNVMKSSFEDGKEHKTPSDDTLTFFEKQDAVNKKLADAIFGDPDNDKDLGMEGKIEEVYKVFTSSRWASKAIIKIVVTIGALAGSGMAMIHFLKELKK